MDVLVTFRSPSGQCHDCDYFGVCSYTVVLIGSRSSCSALILGLLIYKVISHDCHSGFIELKIIFRE